MGLFNWFSWQRERRAMMKEMDRLRADLSETEKKLYYVKRDLAEVEQLLHEAQSGAKLAAEEQDKLKTRLELHKSAAAYWEDVAKNQQKRIAELRQPASELTSVIETTEPAESELERMAWELFCRSADRSTHDSFDDAARFLAERDRRRQASMATTDVAGD